MKKRTKMRYIKDSNFFDVKKLKEESKEDALLLFNPEDKMTEFGGK